MDKWETICLIGLALCISIGATCCFYIEHKYPLPAEVKCLKK